MYFFLLSIRFRLVKTTKTKKKKKRVQNASREILVQANLIFMVLLHLQFPPLFPQCSCLLLDRINDLFRTHFTNNGHFYSFENTGIEE